MPTINGAIWKKVGVVDRTGSHSGSQDEAMVGIHSGMFFEAEMWRILLHHPIRVQISGVFFGFTIFVQLSILSIVFFFQFFKFLIADRAAGRFYQPGVNRNAFINGQALCFELT